MQRTEDNSASMVSYLLEHPHGTFELWLKRDSTAAVPVYEPVRLQRVSGVGAVLLSTEMIAQAIQLDEWMADHFEVFTDGRTSYDERGIQDNSK